MDLLKGINVGDLPEREQEQLQSISETFNQLYQGIQESNLSDAAKTALAHKVLESMHTKGVSVIPPVSITTNEMWSLLDTAIRTDMGVTDMFRTLAQYKRIEPELIDKWAKKAYQTAIYPQIRVALEEAIENIYRYSIPADVPEKDWDLAVAAVCIYQPFDMATLSKLSNLSAVIREVRKMTYQVKNEALYAKVVNRFKREADEAKEVALLAQIDAAKAKGKRFEKALILAN
ncbi:hypothetical protein ACPSLZ_23465 [Vibrio campbellii]|uniref:hypothetical protein n=1 Tax=Vibrio campbellii TaxID=680 RepID=UPI003CE48817